MMWHDSLVLLTFWDGAPSLISGTWAQLGGIYILDTFTWFIAFSLDFIQKQNKILKIQKPNFFYLFHIS